MKEELFILQIYTYLNMYRISEHRDISQSLRKKISYSTILTDLLSLPFMIETPTSKYMYKQVRYPIHKHIQSTCDTCDGFQDKSLGDHGWPPH